MKNNYNIYDITKFTTIDYEGYLSVVLWFYGCNMRCPYCHNKDIVYAKNGNYNFEEILDFLKKRKNRLEAVVLSGGECTLHKNLPDIIKKIKELGYKIKIDTNGTNYIMIKKLIEKNLIDFISLDYKAPKEKFFSITKNKNFNNFEKTLKYLIKINFNFEVRTTIHTDILNKNDIIKIVKDLENKKYKNIFYIQNYIHREIILGNLKEQQRKLNINDIKSNKFKIKFRNFD